MEIVFESNRNWFNLIQLRRDVLEIKGATQRKRKWNFITYESSKNMNLQFKCLIWHGWIKIETKNFKKNCKKKL